VGQAGLGTEHPHMQNIQRYIRELGGKYKKRTIVESWLSKIVDRPRGRPKKIRSSMIKD
jgi:hypothetical protein